MTYNFGVEVGAGDSYSSYLGNNKGLIHRSLLIEPNPVLFEDLSKLADENCKVLECAIGPESNKKKFYNMGYASFLESAPSFMNLSLREPIEKFLGHVSTIVDVKKFEEIDTGDIDVLFINCNGAELYVLNNMKSSPKLIRCCFYVHNAEQWAHYGGVNSKLESMGYRSNILNKNRFGTYYEIAFTKQ